MSVTLAPGQELHIVMDAAVTTTAPDVVSSTQRTFGGRTSDSTRTGVLTGTTPYVAAEGGNPGSSTYVAQVTVFNADSVAVTVTFSVVTGVLEAFIATASIPVGDTLYYDSLGVRVVSASAGSSSGDAYLDIARGELSGYSVVHKFGRNDTTGNSWEKVSLLSGATAFLSAATTVRIKAGGNAADTAAGAGAREVTIQGLDDTGALATEAVATAGASASSATTTSFWRIFRAWVSQAGTYGGSNTGAVTIENSGGGTDLLLIAASEGQSFYGGYSVPLGKTAYVKTIGVTVDSTKAADVRMMRRDSLTDAAAPVQAYRSQLQWVGIDAGLHTFAPSTPYGPYAALTDIWFEAQATVATAAVSVDFEIILEDD